MRRNDNDKCGDKCADKCGDECGDKDMINRRCGDMAANNETEAEEVIGCYKVNPCLQLNVGQLGLGLQGYKVNPYS